MTATTKLALELLASAAANQTLANTTFAQLNQLVMPAVVDKDLATPPGSPANEALYIVAGSPTGAWSGKAGQLAYWLTSTGVWQFIVPRAGFAVRMLDELDASSLPKLYTYTGSAWSRDTNEGLTNPMTTAGDIVVGGASGVAARMAMGSALQVLRVNAAGTGLEYAAPAAGVVTQSIIIASSDEATALTTGAAKVTFRMPYAFTLTAVRASLTTAQAGGSTFTVDINEGGASILSTKLTIDNTEKTSTTAASAAVISDASLADDAEITIDIDQIGDGTAKGLKVYLIGTV